MRPTSVLAALVLALAGIGLAAPADAMPVDGPRTAADKAKLTCYAGVVGVDSKRRVAYYSIKNGKVTDIARSKGKLGFPVTAWGYFDQSEIKGGRVLRMDAIAKNGVPRQVAITQKGGSLTMKATAFAQSGFKPALFAEGYGYYAYTVEKGTLYRYSLTKLRSGKLKYLDRTRLGGGYDALTSLQVATISKVKGALKEILYATASDGALYQIQVPLKKPTKLKSRQLADTGYAGVTELVWSVCDDDYDPFELVAIDPAAGVATWTTIVDPLGKARTTLQGKIKGGKGWDLTASY